MLQWNTTETSAGHMTRVLFRRHLIMSQRASSRHVTRIKLFCPRPKGRESILFVGDAGLDPFWQDIVIAIASHCGSHQLGSDSGMPSPSISLISPHDPRGELAHASSLGRVL
jgi:hypothetical protein